MEFGDQGWRAREFGDQGWRSREFGDEGWRLRELGDQRAEVPHLGGGAAHRRVTSITGISGTAAVGKTSVGSGT